MIEIKKGHLHYCNLCHSENDDVLTITFKYKSEAGGTSIMLCEKCRKELIKVLTEYELAETADALELEKEKKKLKEKILLVAEKTGASPEIVELKYDVLCSVWGVSDVDFETLLDAVRYSKSL